MNLNAQMQWSPCIEEVQLSDSTHSHILTYLAMRGYTPRRPLQPLLAHSYTRTFPPGFRSSGVHICGEAHVLPGAAYGMVHQAVAAMREGLPNPLEEARHPCPLLVIPRLPGSGAHAATYHQDVHPLA